MIAKIISGAVCAGLVLTAAGPVTSAENAPKTKAECKKMSDMKWDATTNTCVKK